MFGYVSINKDSLSQENLSTYESYYCGLCQILKKRFGRKGQVLLNYDMTFLIIMLTGLYEPVETEEQIICPLHPTKKKKIRINEITDYASDMNVLLSWHNFADDWKDDHSPSKLVLMRVYYKAYKKIAAKYPRQVKTIESCMKKLNYAEEVYETNVDIMAGYTGEMLAEIFDWKEDIWSKELKTFGFYLGKFIYLMDAYEDIDKDRKNGHYNVLIPMRREKPDDFDEIVRLMLVSMMAESAKAFERMPIITHAEIVRNIIYSGVWSKYGMLLTAKNKKKMKDTQKKQKAGFLEKKGKPSKNTQESKNE
jgi:hypothetical protein